MGDQHDITRFTTSAITYTKFPNFNKFITDNPDSDWNIVPKYSPPTFSIGNDVWIGGEVRIKQNVHIGDGAVIGARAVVTKNVEPYTVVGGVPARVLKLRFPEKIIDDLLKLQWWNYKFTDFGVPADVSIEKFIDIVSDAVAKGELMKFSGGPLSVGQI